MDDKAAALLAVTNHPGYLLILQVFEIQIERLERQVFSIEPGQTEAVLAAQRVAVGARWAYSEALKAIELLIKQARQAEVKEMTRQEEDDLHIKGLQ